METIICDITAFDYWRTPPIVHLLLDDDGCQSLSGLLKEEDIVSARQAISDLPICRTWLAPNPSARTVGAAAKAVAPAIPLLSTSHSGRVDILVDSHSKCHSSSIVHTRFLANDIPLGASAPIGECVAAVSPAFALLQLSRRATVARIMMLASELCGTFAVYKAPGPVHDILQKLARRKPFPAIGGWKPLIDRNGNLTELWSRPALSTPQELRCIADEASPMQGSKRLRQASSLITPNAASPFEARTGMLLGLSRQRGGEGFKGFAFNKRVNLSRTAQALARRSYCVCDLYWEDGLDVDCQSAVVHDSTASFLSDSDRTAALRSMGVDVLPVTYGQLRDEARFAALSKTIAEMRGMPRKPKTARQHAAATMLRSEIFVDWESAHRV